MFYKKNGGKSSVVSLVCFHPPEKTYKYIENLMMNRFVNQYKYIL